MKVMLVYEPSESHLMDLRSVAPQAEFVIATSEEDAQIKIADCEVVLGNRYFWQSLPYAQRLRWMQSNSMGVDLILSRGGEKVRHIIITSARGLYSDELADHALALLLGVTRGLGISRDHQRAHTWGRWSLPILSGKSALVLGWGATGQEIGRRLQSFGVVVSGVRRKHMGPPMLNAQGVMIYGPDTWREQLHSTDILMMVLPLTADTLQMVGKLELESLPSGAIVVNIGRGDTLDEIALLQLLRSGHLYGAGLDVFANEPLPVNDPTWDESRLLITPHVARALETPPYRWETLFVENLRRYVTAEPLLNVVDQDAGY